jgi:hypothetical protein
MVKRPLGRPVRRKKVKIKAYVEEIKITISIEQSCS